jgi:hypothetical protein
MGEVIAIDFRHRCKIPPKYPIEDTFMSRFCDILRNRGLVEDDILDVLEAIEDVRKYQELDSDLKHVVDVFNNCTAGVF